MEIIVCQKPYLHRLVATPETEGGRPDAPAAARRWRSTATRPGSGAQSRRSHQPRDQRLGLTHNQIEALRADVWENLFYYRGIEADGGTIEDQGPATIDGVACEKIAFIHSANIIYFRYFDQATGRLVFTETTETSAGLKIREQGPDLTVASGIKFPAKIITTQKLPTGVPRLVTLTAEHITVNDVYAESSEFAVPLPPVRLFAAPSSTAAPPAAPSAAPAQPSLPSQSALPAGLALNRPPTPRRLAPLHPAPCADSASPTGISPPNWRPSAAPRPFPRRWPPRSPPSWQTCAPRATGP